MLLTAGFLFVASRSCGHFADMQLFVTRGLGVFLEGAILEYRLIIYGNDT